MTINETAKAAHENAKSKGFFDKPVNIAQMLCLIHSEVSEACEADRKDRYLGDKTLNGPDGIDRPVIDVVIGWQDDMEFKAQYNVNVKGTFEEELADIMIRVMDLAAFKGIDLETQVKAKMRLNATREHMHGKKY